MSEKLKLNRRDFLILSAAGAASIAAVSVLDYEPGDRRLEDVVVIGANNPIENQRQLLEIYDGDSVFIDNKIPFWIPKKEVLTMSEWEKRDLVWGKNFRSLEVVVSKSRFDSDMNGDFVMTMKQHVDLWNRICQFSSPRVDMRTFLHRVVVVSDKFNSHPNAGVFSPLHDHSEFWGDESREEKYLMKIRNMSDGRLGITPIFPDGNPSGEEKFLPYVNDNLSNIGDGVVLSVYWNHEIRHRIGQIPDLSTQEIKKTKEGVFSFRRWNIVENLNGPYLSPVSAMICQDRLNRGIRGSLSHPNSNSPSQKRISDMIRQYTPDEVSLVVKGATEIRVHKPIMEGYYPSKNQSGEDKRFGISPDQIASSEKIDFDKSLFVPTFWKEPVQVVDGKIVEGENIQISPPVYIVSVDLDGYKKDIHFPYSAFAASMISGDNRPIYEVTFTNEPLIPDLDTLNLDMIPVNALDHYKSFVANSGGVVYAYMVIKNTNCAFVWFQQDLSMPIYRQTGSVLGNIIGKREELIDVGGGDGE